MKTKAIILLATLGLISGQASAFCGFYVAKADATLFNQKSQVILVRDGDRTIITMSSDFKGDVKDFAMVVPVPEVLQRNHIRIADNSIFDKLDAYSSPRLVEYHDANPCYEVLYKDKMLRMAPVSMEANGFDLEEKAEADYGVTIEASYTVGEYDILILSAQESGGLKSWLTDNGYKIPANAHEVLDPYIKDGLKFFVVKVNLDAHRMSGYNSLRPLQIAFRSPRFGLPIRLGMANATGDQDLIVYAFTRKGRVELANYRTMEIPSNRNVPEFVQQKFGDFYRDLFKTSYKKEGGKAAFLEYAWDLSSNNFVKCDPCSTTPPDYAELREAGVFWVNNGQQNRSWGGSNYQGDLFFTRMHVRYNRKNFPQDLAFIETPNKESFQGRYIIQHAVTEDVTCDAAQDYYQTVTTRRKKELQELAALTGWSVASHQSYVDEYARRITNPNGWFGEDDFINKNGFDILPATDSDNRQKGHMVSLLAGAMSLLITLVIFAAVMFGLKQRRNERSS
ncbi:MAG: DUF2330 domain-containing protein [Flavobacteriales bacterium]|nr:DUF2330 domain-containing protein [Flavobacteriales bacterium]